jgi:hypothetical protein
MEGGLFANGYLLTFIPSLFSFLFSSSFSKKTNRKDSKSTQSFCENTMSQRKERAYRKGEQDEELWEYYTGDTSKDKKRYSLTHLCMNRRLLVTFSEFMIPCVCTRMVRQSLVKRKGRKIERAVELSRQRKVIQLADLLQNQDDLISGRVKCDCQARKHALIGNCLHCGRVVCEQEGKGPCLFCGEWVGMTEEEFASLDPRAKEAMQHRDKLLEFDKTSKKRTHVFDDHSDYFELSRTCWATEKERAIAEKALKEERKVDRTMEEGHFGADRTLRIQFDGSATMDATVVFDPTSQSGSEGLMCEDDGPCDGDDGDACRMVEERSQDRSIGGEEDRKDAGNGEIEYPIVRPKVDRVMEEALMRHVESLKLGPKPPVLINMGFHQRDDRSVYNTEEIVPSPHVPSLAEKYSTNAMMGVTLSMVFIFI